MTPATGRKHPDSYIVTGYELSRRMSRPEYMSISSLGKYLNRDSGKYKFWLERIYEGLVEPVLSAEEKKEAGSKGRYSYFSNFCEGKLQSSVKLY